MANPDPNPNPNDAPASQQQSEQSPGEQVNQDDEITPLTKQVQGCPNQPTQRQIEAHQQPVVCETPSAFDRLNIWLRQTDHFVGKRLNEVQRKWDIDPLTTAVVCVSTLLVWMIYNPTWAPVVSQFISCCTYPLTESITALIHRDRDGLRLWCVYWFVYDFLNGFNPLGKFTVYYWPIKTVVLMYLFLPPIEYISVLFDAWLMPVIEILYGELHIETLRWSHPFVLRLLGTKREDVDRWDQQHLKAHLNQNQSSFYWFLMRLHKHLAAPTR